MLFEQRKKLVFADTSRSIGAMEKLPVNIVPLWACKVKENGGFACRIALDKVIKDRTRYYGNKEKNIQVSKGGHH